MIKKAMENWGLVTYRETDLLFNPARDTISNKRRIALVISHELAHQWVMTSYIIVIMFNKKLIKNI